MRLVPSRRGDLIGFGLLIAVFIALTAPVTAVFLMRAALFRARSRGDADVPPLDNDRRSRATDADDRNA